MPRFGVRVQIVLISCVPLAFLIALLVIGFQLRSLSVRSADIAHRVTDRLARADRAYESINDLFAEIKQYRTDHAGAVRRYAVSYAAIPGELTAVRLAAGNDRAAQLRAGRFTDDAAQVVAVLDRVFALMRQGKTAAAAAVSNRPAVQKLGPEYLAAKSAFDSGERSDSVALNTATRTSLQLLSTALVVLTVLGIAVTLVLAVGFGLRTARRLRRLVDNATLLAQQKPTLPIEGYDEIAEVDRVYHAMSRELEETTSLQLALLPQRLPEVPGLRMDFSYVPAAAHGKVGGDWSDVFPITDTLLGISIGDVAGHGMAAASTMGMLRQTMRVAARMEELPSRVLGQVNRSLYVDNPGGLATAIFATLDHTTGVLRWSTAGHPSPITVGPDRSITFLDSDGLILGVDAHTTYRDYTLTVVEGSALVFYTDGLVEVNRDYLSGLKSLAAAVVAEYDESSQNIADNIQRRIFARSAPSDDAALLFIGIGRLGARAGEQQHVWMVDARDQLSARQVKRALIWQLAARADDATEFPAVELIYGELMGNVARHTPGIATITLEWNDGVPLLHVEDRGPAFQPSLAPPDDPLAERGRGFLLIAHYAPKFMVRRIGDANRVTVTLPVATPEPLSTLVRS